VDAEDPISDKLEYIANEPLVTGHLSATVDDLEQWTLLLGMSTNEFTALMGARALGSIPSEFGMGQRTTDATTLTTEYYNNLIQNNWMSDGKVYRTTGKNGLAMLRPDLLLVAAPEYLAVVQTYAGDEERFKNTLAAAWTKLMNADRFDGPTRNVCHPKKGKHDGKGPKSMVFEEDSDEDGEGGGSTTQASMLVIESASRFLLLVVLALGVALVMATAAVLFLLFGRSHHKGRPHGKKWAANDLQQPLQPQGSTHNI